MPAGLVKLMTHASGASRRDALGDVEGDRHGAQRRRPGRPGRWSPGRARPRSRATRSSRGAAGQAADPDRREDEVGAAQRRVEVGRWSSTRGGSACSAPSCSSTSATAARRPASTSCRTTSVDPAAGVVAQQGAVDEGHPEAAAAEDGQPHPTHHLDAGRGTARGSPGRLRRWSRARRCRRRRRPAACPSPGACAGRRAAPPRRAAAMRARLTGTSTSGGVHDLPVRRGRRSRRGRRGRRATCASGVLGEHTDQRVVGAPHQRRRAGPARPASSSRSSSSDGEAAGHHGDRAAAQLGGRAAAVVVPMSSSTTSPSRTGRAASRATAVLVRGVRRRPPRRTGRSGSPSRPVRPLRRGAAVDPGQHAGAVQLLQVAADRGGADVERRGRGRSTDTVPPARTLAHDLGRAAVPSQRGTIQQPPRRTMPCCALCAIRACQRRARKRALLRASSPCAAPVPGAHARDLIARDHLRPAGPRAARRMDREFDVFLQGTVFLDIVFTGLHEHAAARHRGLGRRDGLVPRRHRQPRRRRQPARAAHLARPRRSATTTTATSAGARWRSRSASTCRCRGGSRAGTRR